MSEVKPIKSKEELAEEYALKHNVSLIGTINIHRDFLAGYASRDAAFEQIKRERDEATQDCTKLLQVIVDLKLKLDLAVKALEFYADKDNWTLATAQSCSTMIGPGDHYEISNTSKYVAGDHASEAIKKIKET